MKLCAEIFRHDRRERIVRKPSKMTDCGTFFAHANAIVKRLNRKPVKFRPTFFSFFKRLQCSQNCHFLHLIARCFESSQWIFKLFRWFWYKNKRMWYPIEKMYQEASECGWSLEPRENIVWNSKVKFPLDIFLHLSSWLFSFFAKTQREVSKETKAENHSNFFSWAFGFRIHRRYYVRKAGNKSVDFFRSSERENDKWTLNLTRLSTNVA